MNLRRRALAIGVFAAAAAGVTWAVATGTVDNYPATIQFNLSLSGESTTSVTVQASPTIGGGTASASGGPGTTSIPLLVNGGDPDDANDNGYSYATYVYAYLATSSGTTTYLRIDPAGSVAVNNNAAPTADRSVTVPLTVSRTLARVNGALLVTGNSSAVTINSFHLYAQASTAQGNHYGYTYSYPNAQNSASAWTPTVTAPVVQVYGEVSLRHANGETTQHSLATQQVDTSSGAAAASWTIDLSSLAHLSGNLTPSLPGGTTGSTYYLRYYGASQANSGVYGYVYATPSAPSYSVDLPTGDYNFYFDSYFAAPNSYNRLPLGQIAIAPGNNAHSFSPSYTDARTNISVAGFYDNSDLANAQTYLHNDTWSSYGFGYQLSNGSVAQPVPPGLWQSYYTYLRISDQSNPLLPTNAEIYRYHLSDGDFPLVDVGASPIVADEHFTLVRSHVFFDVKDDTNTLQVRSPYLYAYKTTPVASGGSRQSSIYGSGSATPQDVSGLTLVGEPGTYTIGSATAYVGSAQTNFGGGTITFGNPVQTDPPSPGGGPVEVVLRDDPADEDRLHVSLAFDDVSGGGFSTVVETPLGPAPPEGFRMACPGSNECDPIYYDINTTATWSGATKVCVRRRTTSDNWIADAVDGVISLGHYNTATSSWEELPAPTDGTPARFNCSDDSTVCGCATDEACGIDHSDPDHPINVFQVCGMATSFSPFAVLQRDFRFTNKVNGVEYTGPNGPPTLQRFVAPGAGNYRITAWGARGAKGTSAAAGIKGGCGAKMSGTFTLQDGDALEILVGQAGTAATNSGGGGGGTFVMKSGAPILIAGGGGGVRSGAAVDGRGGAITTAGGNGSTSSTYASGFVAGGSNGAGGARLAGYGAGGGGWSGNGASDGAYGDGGWAFTHANQSKGGLAKSCSGGLAHGGYGGGGAGNGCYGGGGGGGYSGGGGGRIGGGGGSLNTGAQQANVEGANASACTASGQGRVVIDYLGR